MRQQFVTARIHCCFLFSLFIRIPRFFLSGCHLDSWSQILLMCGDCMMGLYSVLGERPCIYLWTSGGLCQAISLAFWDKFLKIALPCNASVALSHFLFGFIHSLAKGAVCPIIQAIDEVVNHIKLCRMPLITGCQVTVESLTTNFSLCKTI